MDALWPWIVLALLGAYHGLNPGMGWLFAVARGLQERSRAVVLRSFAPIALGHMASVAAVVALVAAAQPFVSAEILRAVGAIALLAFGVYKLVVRAHPRWVGMRVGARELALWSFLMATAHGAGLMLVPVLLQMPAAAGHATHLAPVARAAELPAEPALAGLAGHDHGDHVQGGAGHGDHGEHAAGQMGDARAAGLAAVAVHTTAMFAAMAAVALLVYERFGLAVLRRAWFNLDLLWAWSLIIAGALSLPLRLG
jgi:hypothetical protein